MSDVLDENINTEGQFLIDLIFNPVGPNSTLRPEEIQLLLAHIGEILREVEEAEKAIGGKV